MKFEVFKEKTAATSLLASGAGDWRWRLRAANGRIIANSGEGYINREDCLHAISLVKSNQTSNADVVDLTNSLSAMLGLKP